MSLAAKGLEKCKVAFATAFLVVGALEEMSTMWADPEESRWVSFGFGSGRDGGEMAFPRFLFLLATMHFMEGWRALRLLLLEKHLRLVWDWGCIINGYMNGFIPRIG